MLSVEKEKLVRRLLMHPKNVSRLPHSHLDVDEETAGGVLEFLKFPHIFHMYSTEVLVISS
jgi:hypothetical protein